MKLDLDTVLPEIKAWDENRNNYEFMRYLFTTGNGMRLHITSNQYPNEDLHIYPALKCRKLVFYSLPAGFDTFAGYSSGELLKSLSYSELDVFEIPLSNQNTTIPEKEGNKRINAWRHFYSAWLCALEERKEKIYNAFFIPQSDVADIESRAMLAFFPDPDDENGIFRPDLIIIRDKMPVIGEFDTVRPVPPFGQSSYFLLDIALSYGL